MGIKGIFTLFAIGGIAAGGYYFKDGIKDAFATGKDTASSLKGKLEDGYQGGNDGSNVDTSYTESVFYDSKGNGGKENNSREIQTQIVYVPLYGYGQQSTQKGDEKDTRTYKDNPTITTYIKQDRKKTSVNNTFTSPYARNNPKAYNKKKYGIDYETLTKASSKTESKRTITEKKQIEAEKARQKFDSRKINNW